VKPFDYNKYLQNNSLLKEEKMEEAQLDPVNQQLSDLGLKEANTHLGNTSNVHPWILTAMEELKDDLDFYLGPKNQYALSRIDFDFIKQKMNNLTRLINKYK
jgi:hypothetical protein